MQRSFWRVSISVRKCTEDFGELSTRKVEKKILKNRLAESTKKNLKRILVVTEEGI